MSKVQDLIENISMKYFLSKPQGRLLILIPILLFYSHYIGNSFSKWHLLLFMIVVLWNVLVLTSSKSNKKKDIN